MNGIPESPMSVGVPIANPSTGTGKRKRSYYEKLPYNKLHVCNGCGADYWATKERSKWCEDCSKLHARGKMEEHERICVLCGKKYKASYRQSKYCSKKCAAEVTRLARVTAEVQLRWLILLRDGFKCQYCGRTPQEHGIALHVDHILPKAAGGEDIQENLITSCDRCNIGKADIDYSIQIFSHFGEKKMALPALNDTIREMRGKVASDACEHPIAQREEFWRCSLCHQWIKKAE